MKHTLARVGRWIVQRLGRVPKRDNRFTALIILALFIATTATAIVHALGNPTGPDLVAHAMTIGKVIAINSLLFPIVTFIIGVILSFVYLPLPRLCLGSFIYTVITTIVVLLIDKSGLLFSYIIGIGYSLTAVVLGLFFILFVYIKNARIIMIAGLLIAGSAYVVMDKVGNQGGAQSVFADYVEPVPDENPGEKGTYDYTFFTYGSGKDIQREAFGESVDQLTPTVDASDFITKWVEKRQSFWGFGPTDLPINGRVWMPEGNGPYPVVLMVHGNHTMEYFSTGGYDYLGEQLASRGFIAVSVDEDFINYSNVSGSPNKNYELRAWIVLQHLIQLQNMNASEETPFYQKVNFDQVGLMGHSRGGQAVAMAADYRRFFEDEALLKGLAPVTIKGIVAIAPTDKRIDSKKPYLHNVSYLLLHGARDADVRDFPGERQYHRSTFDLGDDGFKTSLYIADANHTQFNTGWGQMDLSLPRGLFLNQKQTMAAEAQRQIAKVYMSAFFESLFHDHASYNALFQDYRYGHKWLPETRYVNKFQDATYEPIVQFKHGENKHESLDLIGFKKADIVTPKNRSGSNHLSDALELEWDENARYTIHLAESGLTTNTSPRPEHIVLTMANIAGDSDGINVPEIEVEVETTRGDSVRIPLDEFMPFPQVISTDYTRFALLENLFRDGKYKQSWEPVYQTFTIPIAAFTDVNSAIQSHTVNKLTLHFKSQSGKILIEEIGVK